MEIKSQGRVILCNHLTTISAESAVWTKKNSALALLFYTIGMWVLFFVLFFLAVVLDFTKMIHLKVPSQTEDFPFRLGSM